jgi:hypothetical protein
VRGEGRVRIAHYVYGGGALGLSNHRYGYIYTISSYMNKLVVQFQIFLYDAVDLGVFVSSLSPSVVRSAGRVGRRAEGGVCV